MSRYFSLYAIQIAHNQPLYYLALILLDILTPVIPAPHPIRAALRLCIGKRRSRVTSAAFQSSGFTRYAGSCLRCKFRRRTGIAGRSTPADCTAQCPCFRYPCPIPYLSSRKNKAAELHCYAGVSRRCGVCAIPGNGIAH